MLLPFEAYSSSLNFQIIAEVGVGALSVRTTTHTKNMSVMGLMTSLLVLPCFFEEPKNTFGGFPPSFTA